MQLKYKVDEFRDIPALLLNLANAIKHQEPEQFYADIVIKPVCEMDGKIIVGYEINVVCLSLDEI